MLYYRDPLESIESILKNPLFSEHIQYIPRAEYDLNGKRRYNEWVMSDGAWEMQVCKSAVHPSICGLTVLEVRLPQGATLLGIVLSLDKTGLTSMTGDHTAHLLLITLANTDSTICSSSLSHALKLLALIPVPKFVGVKKGLHGILENQLLHTCLDFVNAPLKLAA